MSRVTPSEVLTIMDNVELSDSIVEAYISGAEAFVNENLSTTSLTESTLKEIERWLTAHLISISRERQSKKESAGKASIEYAGAWGEGLKMTSFGQTAIALDMTGTLNNLSLKTVTFYAIPTKQD